MWRLSYKRKIIKNWVFNYFLCLFYLFLKVMNNPIFLQNHSTKYSYYAGIYCISLMEGYKILVH